MFLPVAVHVDSSAGLPAVYSDKWEIPNADFPSPYRSKQGVHGPRRAHSTTVTSLRETRYQHEKITGEFFQGAPTSTKPIRASAAGPCASAMLFICKIPTYARPYTGACVRRYTWVYARGHVWNASRGNRRYESALYRDTKMRGTPWTRREQKWFASSCFWL